MAGIPVADLELQTILSSARGSFELIEKFPSPATPAKSSASADPGLTDHGIAENLEYIRSLTSLINRHVDHISRKTNGIDRSKLAKLNECRRELAKVLGELRKMA